jgi:phage FluMu protein Com
MPIRFRCHACNQLLGIARRKAGMQVKCPTCRTEVTVPKTDEVEREEEPAAAAPEPLFERDDFEAMLNEPAGTSASRAAAAPPAPVFVPPQPAAAQRFYESEPYAPPSASASRRNPPPVGILISPARATVLTVAVILLLALAFGAGLLVGGYYLGGG